ncbi:MAG TPA: winged helix-turn-helix domain-containing protein [Vicinamibacterales bacterium]|nr:winged helix-turn-helix domain-containing protein [Vicinamibacterales bacterium]
MRLQDQPFQVLVALLERHGEIVTRDELRDRLWPRDTFVAFDKSLGVALTKVRAALGDDAGNPRFVETVPRRGYRFIAPVAVESASLQTAVAPASAPVSSTADVAAPGASAQAVAPTAPHVTSPQVLGTEPITRPRSTGFVSRWSGVLIGSSCLVLTLVLVFGFISRRSGARHDSTRPRVSVVVAEFDNHTGDQVFAGSLRRAAAVTLRQSPFLSVMADATIADALQTLGRAPDDALTAPLARDVCTHTQSRVLVDGDIALAADTYTLVVQATRCGDGGVIARETETFTRKDDALAALGREIEHVRAALGESRESLQAYDVSLPVATTNSLEALRAFNLGMDLRLRDDNAHAIPALETAVALDPQFALAYAQLGSAYSNVGDEAKGTPYFIKAFDLRDRVTEPERLLITGRYFDIVTREMEKAIENYRLWTSVYPDEWQPFNGLANDADLIGRYDVAAPAAARALALDDTQLFPRVNLMTADCALNKLAECLDQARRILARTPDDSSAHLVLYVLARHAGDEAAAEREVAWAAQHPSDSGVLYVEAEDAGLHGRFAEMTRLFRQVARIVRDGGNAEGAGNTLAYSAVVNSLAGRFGDAQTDANAAAADGRNEIILGSVGIVAARAGRMEAADQSLATMNRLYPLSTYALGMYGPYVRCAELAQKPASAADVTRATAAGEPYAFGQQGSLNLPYLCGLAYMAAHAPDRAAVDFQQLIDHVGVDPLSPLYAMSYLGLARANAAMGKWDESRRAYETLRGLWADADRDAPLVRAAMSEAAAARAGAPKTRAFR